MIITPKKHFNITYREAGTNSYYVAKCGNTVYTRKSLTSLESFLRGKGADFSYSRNNN